MKDSGIMRRVDSLGRFVLPKELRRQLQIECNDYLQIYTEGEKNHYPEGTVQLCSLRTHR